MKLERKSLVLGAVLVVAAGPLAWKIRNDVTFPHDEKVDSAAQARRPERAVPAEPLEKIAEKWKELTDPSRSREARLEIVRTIPDGLSAGEVNYLLGLLDHRPPEWNQEEWWVVLNEIMDQLRKAGIAQETYCRRLSELVGDSSLPEVVRDYSIQHLSQSIAPVVDDGIVTVSEEVKERALRAITSAIKDQTASHTTVPGTGFLALAEISPRLEPGQAEAAWDEVRSHALEVVAGRTESGLPIRVAAIQAVAIRRDTFFLSSVRELAASNTVNQSVRLSAIAALGLYGQAADRPILEAIAGSGTQYQYAAKAALARIGQ